MKDGSSKSQRTKEALGESYRRLLSEKPASKITVTEIAEGCGMTAPTFYNHFKDKHALIVWIYINDSSCFMSNFDRDDYNWKDTLQDALEYYYANCRFVIDALAHVNGRTEFMSIMEEVNIGLLMKEIEKKLDPEKSVPEYIAEFVKLYCLGTVRYTYDWLMKGCPLPPEKVAELFEDGLPYRLRPYLL